MKWWLWFKKWARSQFFTRWWWKEAPKPYQAVWITDPPDFLSSEHVYLVGAEGSPSFALMVCPCGCGATLAANLLPGATPRWSWDVHNDGTISLHPSLWRIEGCRSHFLLRRGQIIWCNTTILPRPPQDSVDLSEFS